MNWRIILAIAQKDIVDAFKNSYLLFALVLPIGMSLLFRLIFPGPDELLTLTVAVYDPGNSRLVAALRALPQVKLLDVASDQQMPEAVEKNAVGGLAVPIGFDAAIKAGQKPELTIYVNRKHGGGEIAGFRQLVEQQVWALVGQETPARITWSDVAVLPGSQSEVEFSFDRYMLVMFLVISLAMAGTFVVPTLLVEEKEKHTLQALLVSPASPAEVVTGKALTGLVYSLLSTGVLIALNQGWVGNWYVTALAVLLGALFTVGVGLLMGAMFRNTQQVNTWSSIVMLALISPSWIGMLGSATPLDIALRLMPTRYLVETLTLALVGEASLERVWSPLAILAGSVIVAFAAVVWKLRREER